MEVVRMLGQIILRLFIAACVSLLCLFTLMFATTLVSFALEEDGAAMLFAFAAGMCLVAAVIGAQAWWRDRTWFGAVKHSLYCALLATVLGLMTGAVIPQMMDLSQTDENRGKFLYTIGITSLIGGGLSALVLTWLRALFVRLNNAPPPPSPLFDEPSPRAQE
jgi:hypothetical protein